MITNNSAFTSNSAIIVCDEEGEVILANEKTYTYFQLKEDGTTIGNIYELCEGLNISESQGIATVEVNNEEYFIAYKNIETNGWKIYSILNKKDAKKLYRDSQNKLIKTISVVIMIFVALIVYVVLLNRNNMKRKTREVNLIKYYNESYKNILSESHCAVVEYDTNSNEISMIQENFGDVKLGSLNGSLEEYNEFKSKHPEFDFRELEVEIDIVKKQRRTCVFETMLSMNGTGFYWLKVKLIPILDDAEEVCRIYCALFDVSDLHDTHETALDTYAKIPGAVHRHVLNNPIHMNYYSDGLCKMLGYTHAEIDEIIGMNYQYNYLIVQEDRQKYSTFVTALAQKGGLETCEYRMLCKNGTIIEVSETMDAKYGSSGIMYGYAVVTNLSKLQENQKRLQEELEITQKKLAQSRAQNAASQMQPHFLYNALASIREVVLDDPEYASNLIYDFTTHLRACVRTMSNGAPVPFKQELENIKAYVNIEKMRFGDRLQIEYDCPITNFNIIQLSIQPLVENSIRHGIFQRGMTGGKVIVRTFKNKDSIFVSVEDNGIGFDYDKIMQEINDGTRDSCGLTNLMLRFKSMMNADVTVESEVGIGTKVTVTIPLHKKEEGEEYESYFGR